MNRRRTVVVQARYQYDVLLLITRPGRSLCPPSELGGEARQDVVYSEASTIHSSKVGSPKPPNSLPPALWCRRGARREPRCRGPSAPGRR